MKKMTCTSGNEIYPGIKKLMTIMKLTTFLILISMVSAFAGKTYSQSKTLNLNMKNATVKEVLEAIEEQSEFYFMYSSKVVDVNRAVSVDISNKKVKEVLDELFTGTDVDYTIKDRIIVLTTPEVLKDNSLDALQQKTVSGRVADESGQPLPGVTVVVKGTAFGTITDADGKYSLSDISDDAILVFSFVGMKSQEVAVAGQSIINVSLEEETIGLDEVVAIGYGIKKKSLVTGAISSVSKDDLQNTSVTRGEQILQGKTAGVQVVAQSGAPGAEVKVRIRGYASNGASEPLYIVNGMKTSDINNIDPNDIESMEVLKDAASSAIYGAEGANGVVIVKTKEGNGDGILTYNFSSTWQNVTNLPTMMNAKQYLQYNSEAGFDPVGVEGTDTNWLNEIFETSLMQRHHLSFSKGNDVSNFILSMSYLDNDGILKRDKDQFKRYTLMFNSDSKLKDWIKVGHNISYSYTKRTTNLEDSEYDAVIGNSLLLDPITPITYGNSIPAYVQTVIDQGKAVQKNSEGMYYGISQNITSAINPLELIDIRNVENIGHSLIGNVFTEITPIKGLTITSRLGLNGNYSNIHTWSPVYYYTVDRFNDLSSVSDNTTLLANFLWENFANYNKTIGDHDFSALVGMSYDDKYVKTNYGYGGPLVKDQLSYSELDFISSQSNDYVTGNSYSARKLSYYGRLSYNYKGKYLFDGTIRRDAASTFYLPKNNRWGTFPSFSAGWIVSNEDFFKVKALTSLKLRASWGQNGSLSNLGNFMYSANIGSIGTLVHDIGTITLGGLTLVGPDGTIYTAAQPAQLSNNNLKWETSEQTDLGVDAVFFDGSLVVAADYYWKKTKDLLTQSTPPMEAGNKGSIINAGNVMNRGFEFNANYSKKVGEVKYGIGINFSTLHNEVTYLPGEITRINGSIINNSWIATAFEKGYPVWYFRGYKFAGVDPATGDPTFMDINKDGSITTDDMDFIGSGIPNFIYGVNINLEYKNFDFKAFIQGQSGNDVLIGFLRNDRPLGNKLALFYDERWTTSNTDAQRPRPGSDQKYWFSDQMLQDGSFLRIKQLQFGYSFPSSLLNSVKLKSSRIYLSLDDFLTFTKYKGVDPEAGSSTNSSLGIDRGVYPVSRKIMLGLSVSF